MFDLASFATHLITTGAKVEMLVDHGLEKGAHIIEKSAKGAMGTYEFGWAPLAESTLSKKAADTPLVETGQLRDSIEHNVGHMEAWVGTNDSKAFWQEFGTSRIPARPFIGGAVEATRDEVITVIAGDVVAQAFGGRGS